MAVRFLYCLLACVVVSASAAPVRVLTPFVETTTQHPPRYEQGQQLARCLGIYLQARCAEAPEVIAVDPERARLLNFERRHITQWPASDWLGGLQPRLDLDAIVDVVPEGEGVRVLLITPAGVRDRAVTGSQTARLVRETAGWIATELELPAASREVLTAARLPDDGFAILLLSTRWNTEWIYNRGEHRLDLLSPYQRAAETNPWVNAMLLDAGAEMSLDKRKVDRGQRATDMLRGPVRRAFGTTAERDALRFLRVNRVSVGQFETELLELATPLGRDAADDLLDAALDGGEMTLPDATADAKGPSKSARLGAVRGLGAMRSAKGRDLLTRLTRSTDATIREAAVSALAEYDSPRKAQSLSPDMATPEAMRAALRHPDTAVVLAALASLPATLADADRQLVMRLANSPVPDIAAAASHALRGWRPDAEPARSQFDLQTASFYRRLQIIERWQAAGDGPAIDSLAGALANPHAQVRAAAFTALAQVAPDRARDSLPAMLQDPADWVRLYAAAAAVDLAAPAVREPLEAALARETEPVVRLFLQDAAALAAGNPLPPRPPAAHPVRGFGICGHGSQALDSPFDWYYELNPGPNDMAPQLHAAGRAIVGRTNQTAKNPVQILFHPQWQHLWWSAMADELRPLEWLDGVVVGEESMYFRPWQGWELGWVDFCLDSGLDPQTVEGDRERLSAPQRLAYLHWEEERAIDGFNRLYRFTKLYFGRLRPGFTVVTFMPQQNGPCVADARWEFDIGAAYHYQAGSRLRYNTIRRFKTLWPERPVLWLVNGTGESGTASGGALLKYNATLPDTPFPNPGSRAWTDAMVARIAGAEVGYFSIWLAAHMKQHGQDAKGSWLHLEDIGVDSPELEKARRTAFNGVEDYLRAQTDTDNLKDGMTGDMAGDALAMDLEEKDPEKDPTRLRVKAMERDWTLGALMEQRQLYTIAQTITLVPSTTPRPAVLWIGGKAEPEHDATTTYDYLQDVNKLPNLVLTRYRFIGVVGGAEVRLRDATIVALGDWLATGEGVLYVRGDLNPDNAAEAATPDDMDGRLQRDWPWEDRVRRTADGYETKTADGWAAAPTGPVVVQGMRAIFSAEPLAGRALREQLTAAFGDAAIADFGPQTGIVQAVFDGGSTRAIATAGVLPGGVPKAEGRDLLTGELHVALTPGRRAALVSDGMQTDRAIVRYGTRIISEAPMQIVADDDTRLTIRAEGEVIISGGRTKVTVADPAIPLYRSQEALVWYLTSTSPGIGFISATNTVGSVTRLHGEFTITFNADFEDQP